MVATKNTKSKIVSTKNKKSKMASIKNKSKMVSIKNKSEMVSRKSKKTNKKEVQITNGNAKLKIKKSISNVSEKKQSTELDYTLQSLVRDITSIREAATLSFDLLLVEILKLVEPVQIEDILKVTKNQVPISNGSKEGTNVFGKLFTNSAIAGSERSVNDDQLAVIILALFNLWQGRPYVLNSCYEVICNLFTKFPSDTFKEKVWPLLKEKLSVGWEGGSPDLLCFLVLCIRMFPECITEDYLKKHWSTSDIFAEENYEHLKKFFKQTTSTLPMLHPLCLEFLTYFKSTEDKAAWKALIEENFYDEHASENTDVGFKLVEKILAASPKKQVIKIVISPNFCLQFKKKVKYNKLDRSCSKQLIDMLCNLTKENTDPEIQFLILKSFLQPPGDSFCGPVLKTSVVSSIIKNLAPDAVKMYCEFLKSIAFSKNEKSDKVEINMDRKCCQAVSQIGSVVNHPNIINEIEWRMDVIKFLFIHSFFKVEAPSVDILHCDATTEFSDQLRTSFKNTFYNTMGTLCHNTEQRIQDPESYLQSLMSLAYYVDQLLEATETISPCFPIEKVENSWKKIKSTVHELDKQSQKDDKSNAFKLLFLQLGLHLFNDPEYISKLLEDLHVCCKKAIRARNIEDDPEASSWIVVVVDTLLSLLSKPSLNLQWTASSVFSHFCTFITEEALQQILSVISQEKSQDEPMLQDEGQTQPSEDKTMLTFRSRCLSLVEIYLRSEPPMRLALLCIEPILAASKYVQKSKHNANLLSKVISNLQVLTKTKKFENPDNETEEELKTILENLVSKCRGEKVAKELYSLCIFVVLCFRSLEQKKSEKKKSTKAPVYVRIYLSALDDFLKGERSFPTFLPLFETLMEACPDLSLYFIEFCEKALGEQQYKANRCLGIINKALNFSKDQQCINNEKWTELGNRLVATSVKIFRQSMEAEFVSELLRVIHAVHNIVLEKTTKSPLENNSGLLPLLRDNGTLSKILKSKAVKKIKRKLILALGGAVPQEEESMDTESKSVKRKSMSKNKKLDSIDVSDAPLDVSMDTKSKSEKRKSMSTDKKKKMMKCEANGV